MSCLNPINLWDSQIIPTNSVYHTIQYHIRTHHAINIHTPSTSPSIMKSHLTLFNESFLTCYCYRRRNWFAYCPIGRCEWSDRHRMVLLRPIHPIHPRLLPCWDSSAWHITMSSSSLWGTVREDSVFLCRGIGVHFSNCRFGFFLCHRHCCHNDEQWAKSKWVHALDYFTYCYTPRSYVNDVTLIHDNTSLYYSHSEKLCSDSLQSCEWWRQLHQHARRRRSHACGASHTSWPLCH